MRLCLVWIVLKAISAEWIVNKTIIIIKQQEFLYS